MADKKWIQGAVKNKGALHRALGIPMDKKIPYGLLVRAAKRKGRVGQMARLAMTLNKVHK